VASAGLYASLHLAPDRSLPAPHHSSFFIDRMPFLPPNQQRQSTEGTSFELRVHRNAWCEVLPLTTLAELTALPRPCSSIKGPTSKVEGGWEGSERKEDM